MALENEQEESQQQQPKRTKTLASSEKVEDPQSTHTLLPEIIMEILVRLPVESLLRCKSVCKSWRALIFDPHFVKYHLSLSNSNSEYAHHRVIMYTWITRVDWCSLHDVIYNKPINMFELDYPLKHLQNTVSVAGSCNGLLCILVEDDIVEEETAFIWNPSTRRSNRLPSPGFTASDSRGYSFGYDKSSDDYKVVSLARDIKNGARSDTNCKAMICSLKSGNWKRIGDFPRGFGFSILSGKFFSGALHWPMIRDIGSFSSWAIISLDLATETYGELVQPVYDKGNKYLQLGVSREWLCLLCDYTKNRKTDVWVMKDYGVKDSWTKLASIQNLTDTSLLDQLWGFFTFVNDGKFLLRRGKKLVLYDVKNGSSLEIKNYNGALAAWIVVESLVSPDVPEIVDK